MTAELFPNLVTYLVVVFGAFCLGLSKTGFHGLAIINVLIVTEIFGAKNSVGIILPLLVVCDLTVFPIFRKWATWKDIVPLIIPTSIGLFIGWYILGTIDDNIARKLIGIIILLMICLNLVKNYYGKRLTQFSNSKGFYIGSCLTIGVSTMLANAAGPIYSIYAIVRNYPKEKLLGIGARFFLLINIVKLPILGNLNLVNSKSLLIDLYLLPGIFSGIVVGKILIKKASQDNFEKIIIGLATASSLWLIFGS